MSSVELRTFKKHIRTLNLAVRSHIIPLAENLLAEELISPDNYCSLTTAKDDEVERAAKLLSFVLIKVELSPRNYHVFVKVLISDRSTYKEVLNVLEPIYKEPTEDFSEVEDRSDRSISDTSCKLLTSGDHRLSLTPPTLSPSSLPVFADGASFGADSAVFTPPVYRCAAPGCKQETSFDPNTGDHLSPYCDQHHFQSYTQLQHTTSVPSFTKRRQSLSQSLFSGHQQHMSNESDNDEDIDVVGLDVLSGLDTLLTSFSSIKSLSSAPLFPIQAWLPSTSAATTPTSTSKSVQQCKLPGCNRPVWVDEEGIASDFCGKTHADRQQQNAIPFSTPVAPVAPHLKCQTQGCPNQKYLKSNGGYFDYCSKSCRDNAMLTSASTPNLLQNPSGYGTCSLPGCTRPKYCDPANGRVHDYCGRTHSTKARAQGIQPASQNIIRQANSGEFTTVSQKFIAAWKKGKCPNVNIVYVVSNSTLESRWSSYQQTLRDQTVEEHYHGTKLTCDLTQPSYSAPCNDEECGICGISSSGLDRRSILKKINFQRFGHGFYLAPNSSKCHTYTVGANGYRAMLLCDVCPGKKYPLKTDNVDLKGPPPGYDCVYGQVGGSLNYEEIVFYNPDAVLPRYIIVYQKDGVHKIAK